MNDELFLLILDKGVLAISLLIVAYIFNRILQLNKLRNDTASEIANDRANAYKKLWTGLAGFKPLDEKNISAQEVENIKIFLVNWYHEDANALYMSWKTAKKYMRVRDTLDITKINSDKIRKDISSLRTQLKVDCGIYSYFESILPLT